MPAKFKQLIDHIRKLSAGELQSERQVLLEELGKIQIDFEKLNFRVQRSIKEKNIISSLLTRTSQDLKQVSDRLKVRAEELSTLLTTIPAYVYFKDLNLNYIIVNQAFADLVGIPATRIIGKKATDIFSGYNYQDYFLKENRVIATGMAFYDIEEEIRRNERHIWVNSNIAPIRNTENKIVGLIGISWDITDRKLQEEELCKAKELAEAGTHAKNEFIASVSHEFRTPMNGILGLSNILRNTPLNPEQLDLLNGITSSAENLLVLLNDVLDFSAIEAGKMSLDYQPFMLDRILEDISLVINLKAREKLLAFSIRIQGDVPNALIGDAVRLRQILLNLTNNAVKFTEKGSVDIKVSLVEKDNLQTILRFDVTDTGIGIPDSAKESLFKVFSRVKQDPLKPVAGTGLGLSICKKLSLLMGGEIGFESTSGMGSTFWFTLPFVLSELPTRKIEELVLTRPDPYNGLTALVAEDNLINQRIVEFQLEKMGFTVDLTANGMEALEKFAVNTYDILILDIQMPLMDGYQTAKKIREGELLSDRHIPIIAVTANAMKGDRELYLNAGMDDYISKPFTYETLLNAISGLLPGVD